MLLLSKETGQSEERGVILVEPERIMRFLPQAEKKEG